MRLQRGEILMVLAEEFGISFADEELNGIHTPAMLIEAILEKSPRQLRNHVATIVKEIAVDGLGVPEQEYDEDGDHDDSWFA